MRFYEFQRSIGQFVLFDNPLKSLVEHENENVTVILFSQDISPRLLHFALHDFIGEDA